MRYLSRCLLVASLVLLAAGPALAAPLVVGPPTLTMPTGAPASPFVRALGSLVSLGSLAFGIAIKKDISTIAQKFVTRAQAAAPDYKTGVSNAGGKWETNTGAAESAFDQGIQAAITNKSFTKGVSGKGGKYQANAVALGSQRYGPGVANAQSAYQTAMQPVLSALQAITLPPRQFRGSPGNQARANAVSTALAALRANR